MRENRKENRMDIVSTLHMLVGLACGTRMAGNMYCCSHPDGSGIWQQGIGVDRMDSIGSLRGSRKLARAKSKSRYGQPVVCASTVDG